jgi:hypothetical protein
MVSGEDHDRHAGLGEQLSRAIENSRAQLVVFKGVAGQQQDIGPQSPRRPEHDAQHRRPVAALGAGSAIFVDMQIRAVDKDNFASRVRGSVYRESIAPASGDAQSSHRMLSVDVPPASLRAGKKTRFGAGNCRHN